jgi:hypothetical protein
MLTSNRLHSRRTEIIFVFIAFLCVCEHVRWTEFVSMKTLELLIYSSPGKQDTRSRRRKPSLYWDVPPPGFEHITPLQYKAMQGML